MVAKFFLVLFSISLSLVSSSNSNEIQRHIPAIDPSFLEDALDAEECHRQITTIRSSSFLTLQFQDAGLRTPRDVLMGNSVDLGNYFQCIGINHQLEEMQIAGKYCSIQVPFNQSYHLPRPEDMISTQFDPNSLRLDNETISKIEEYHHIRRELQALSGDFDGFDSDARSTPSENNPLASTVFRLGLCVPKPCTTEQAISSFFFNISAIGFQYREDYCRLPGDKPWTPADYVAIGVFALLGFLTVVCTSYDLCYRFIFKKDVKQQSVLARSFSVYTNGQRLTTFSSGSGNLQCLDGIRTLAMLWVIVGHSFSTEPVIANLVDTTAWLFSAKALWITAATMTVDTFFTMAGVLLVYTTAEKMNHISFLKNLHWFYLNRYLRVTPMLAITIILQAAVFNRMADGPHWTTVAVHTGNCRANWWSTLLHVQNFVHPNDMCVTHSWYVAIDFQLYVVSPLVLVWVLTGKKQFAWMGLLGGLAAILIASTVYCFQINMLAGTLVPSRFSERMDYFKQYYFHTLTRASPFFVGLICGYILHIYRNKKLRLPWFVIILLWSISAGILAGIFYFNYRIKQFDWDNQLVDNLMNSFMRPAFALGICWLIVACVNGYAGPINWFLSLDVWRLPARLSYGMFLFHYPLMYTLNATTVAPIYFSVRGFTFKFLSYTVLAVVYAFVFTLLVDSPVTVLFKQLMDSAKKKNPVVKGDKTMEEDKSGIPNSDHKKINGALDGNNDDDYDKKAIANGDSKNMSEAVDSPTKNNVTEVKSVPSVIVVDDDPTKEGIYLSDDVIRIDDSKPSTSVANEVS